MDAVVRAITVYLVLLLIFRISGKRSLAQTTPFDLILMLIISEAIQQAMLDGDNSMTNGLLLVLTLVSFDILLSIAKQKSARVAQLLEGTPIVVFEGGKPHPKYMERERISEDEVLQAARELHGLKTLAEVDYAVLEQSGQITIVPRKKSG